MVEEGRNDKALGNEVGRRGYGGVVKGGGGADREKKQKHGQGAYGILKSTAYYQPTSRRNKSEEREAQDHKMVERAQDLQEKSERGVGHIQGSHATWKTLKTWNCVTYLSRPGKYLDLAQKE